ncbi:helix-turn-helix domain-containing protein [Saccharomonospora cyanea]|uniref:helix-turn-helix domain-containing protein n=1 Tax=Saccharomonospora cyanea TaxID=40989 RepID=UPI000A03B5FF|nr:helix-turn-helix transcriptional regulator [Saccharomonospora cyanea]
MTPSDDPNPKTSDTSRGDESNEQGLPFEHAFAKAVERERLTRGWTAEEAARRAGVSAKTWQRIEDGKPARPSTYFKIDEAFEYRPGAALDHFSRHGHLHDLYSDTRPQPEAKLADTVFADDSPFSGNVDQFPEHFVRNLRDYMDRLPVDTVQAVVELALMEAAIRKEAEVLADLGNADTRVKEAERRLAALLETEDCSIDDARKSAQELFRLRQSQDTALTELKSLIQVVTRGARRILPLLSPKLDLSYFLRSTNRGNEGDDDGER